MAFNRPNHNFFVSYQLDQKWCGIIIRSQLLCKAFCRLLSVQNLFAAPRRGNMTPKFPLYRKHTEKTMRIIGIET
ncbi:hypothetical protein ACVZHT_17075, partial [Vibrio diabolicus]